MNFKQYCNQQRPEDEVEELRKLLWEDGWDQDKESAGTFYLSATNQESGKEQEYTLVIGDAPKGSAPVVGELLEAKLTGDDGTDMSNREYKRSYRQLLKWVRRSITNTLWLPEYKDGGVGLTPEQRSEVEDMVIDMRG